MKVKIISKTIHELKSEFKDYVFHDNIVELQEEIDRWCEKFEVKSVDINFVVPYKHNNGGSDCTIAVATILYE